MKDDALDNSAFSYQSMGEQKEKMDELKIDTWHSMRSWLKTTGLSLKTPSFKLSDIISPGNPPKFCRMVKKAQIVSKVTNHQVNINPKVMTADGSPAEDHFELPFMRQQYLLSKSDIKKICHQESICSMEK